MADRTTFVNARVTVFVTVAAPPRRTPMACAGRGFALALILAATLLRLLYLWGDCPLDLAPDEAHYWDWSRRPDWSYYSKGPLVAWLIRASCTVFGETMPAVRLPAVLCGALTLWGLYVLTLGVYRSELLALGVVALGLIFPALAVGALLMTIDAPFVCCWTWGLVLAQRVTCRLNSGERGLTLPWVMLGLVIGVGILAKYTMVLFIPSLWLFLLSCHAWRERAEGRRKDVIQVACAGLLRLPRGFYLMTVVAALCSLPILIWNAQHEWISFYHVGRQAGLQKTAGFDWRQPVEFLAGQFGLLLGFWFIGWVMAMMDAKGTARPTHGENRPFSNANAWFLWCFSAPTFLGFLALSFHTRVEPNWPVVAYLSGMVLTAGWIVRQCRSPVAWWRRLTRASVASAAVLGFALTALIHHTEWLYPLLDTHNSEPGISPIRRLDPTCRLRGWRTLAAEVELAREELRAEGMEPVLVGTSWALPGEISFYLNDHPEVYSIALAAQGRRSQYDFWRPNPIWEPEQFRGRTLICIGDLPETAISAFGRMEAPREVTHIVAGRPVARWKITVCRDFRGFGEVSIGGY